MLEYGILVFTSFMTLINPIGVLPTFLSLTSGFSDKKTQKTALHASITLFVTIMLFAGLGDWIFNFFGITINGLRIVGGIILIRMGFDLVSGHSAQMKKENIEEEDDIAITPLGFPILAGAGTITTAIVFGNQAEDINHFMLFIAIAIVSVVLTYLILSRANKMMKVMGKNGRQVLNRIMGLITMMIAMEFIFAGIKPVAIEIGIEIMKNL